MKIMEIYNRYSKNMPSWLWLLLILFGMTLIIAVPVAFIYAVSHFEGVAGIIFIVIGWFVFGNFARSEKGSSFALALAIGFYALMGVSVDQTGNILYNQPFALMCPKGTTYGRNVLTLHPLPGRTDFIQNFQCLNSEGKVEYTVPVGYVLLIRFAEYVLIAYMLLGIRVVIVKIRGKSRTDILEP